MKLNVGMVIIIIECFLENVLVFCGQVYCDTA